jgi:hypothetical protein
LDDLLALLPISLAGIEGDTLTLAAVDLGLDASSLAMVALSRIMSAHAFRTSIKMQL